MAVSIPGLFVRSVGDDHDAEIRVTGFTRTFVVPDSHRFGNCQPIFDFEKLNKIEEGSFGTLYKCRKKSTNNIYCLKKFKMPDTENGMSPTVQREILILKQIKHANIVNSHGVVAGKNLSSHYLLLDYCVTSLKNLIEKNVEQVFEKAVIKCIMKQLLSGIQYIHGATIIHRDVCCENIQFSPAGIVKIAGFQSAKSFKPGDLPPPPEICHVKYCAPEILLKAERCTPGIDMWSAGCVFARLLLKQFLFDGDRVVDVLTDIFNVLGMPSENTWQEFAYLKAKLFQSERIILKNEFSYSNLSYFLNNQSLASMDIIAKLLVYDPSKRMNAQVCLKHSYFSEIPEACGLGQITKFLNPIEASK